MAEGGPVRSAKSEARSARRWTLGLVAGLLLGVAGLLFLGAGVSSNRSTLDRGPEGTAALASVLRGLGHDVESLRLGLITLVRRPAGSVLFMPSAPGLIPTVLGEAELHILEEFIAKGSTVIVVTHYPTALLDPFDVEFEWDALERPPRTGPGYRQALPVLPLPVTLGEPLAVAGRGGITLTGDGNVLYSVDGVPIVASIPAGKGEVIVVSDPSTITNRGISRAGNLDLWVRLVRDRLRDDGVVMFDDLHAGATDDKGTIAYARRAGLLPALLLAVLLAGLYLWRAGARFGSVLPPKASRNPRTSSELVHAIAGLYERAGLRSHALAVLSRRFRRAVERRSGLRWDRDSVAPWVERELGPGAGRAFERIRRGFASMLSDPDPPRDETLELARLVHRFETEHLNVRRRPSGQPPNTTQRSDAP